LQEEKIVYEAENWLFCHQGEIFLCFVVVEKTEMSPSLKEKAASVFFLATV
jgi:hypothetical protein